MKSGYFANHFTTAGFASVCGGQTGCLTGLHGGKPGEHIFKIFLGIEAEATAIFDNGIKDGAAKGKLVDPSLEAAMDDAALSGADGLAQGGTGLGFSQLRFYMIEVGEWVLDPGDDSWRLFGGFEKFPSNMGVAAHELDPLFVFGPRWIDDVAVALNDAQEGAEFGIDWLVCFGDLGWLKESIDACGVAPGMPMVEDGPAWNVRRPEVASLGFATAGVKVSDRGFVKLPVRGSPMLVLNFSVDDREPIGGSKSQRVLR